MHFQQQCIGFTGQLAAGKGEALRILCGEFGFKSFSLSDRVREVARARGLCEVTREMLQDVGDSLRRDFGGEILAKLTAGMAFTENLHRVAIDSIRNPAEVAFLRAHPNFRLVAVVAPQEERGRRLIARARPSDPKTYEEFLERDARDLGVGQGELGQQVGKCIEMANFILFNSGTLEQFEKNIHNMADLILSNQL
ncbi:MAG: AAA family ATPase [bacterium]|nr:AAA family ATPase [bacterium]